jgi:hypothetical protein
MALNTPDSKVNFEPLPPLVKGGNSTREGLETTYKLWLKGRAIRLREIREQATRPPLVNTPLASRPRF